jgi:putative hydrolase of the HAD superfamily
MVIFHEGEHPRAAVDAARAIHRCANEIGAELADRFDPLAMHVALERLGLQPHEVLHVGDSDVDDVKGAKAAGMRVAWVDRDGRSRHRDVPPPDFEIPDLIGLLALL